MRGSQVLRSLGEILDVSRDYPQTVVGGEVCRIKLQSLFELLLGLIRMRPAIEAAAQVVISGNQVRVEANCLPKRVLCGFPFTLRVQHNAQQIVARSRMRIDREARAHMSFGLRDITL